MAPVLSKPAPNAPRSAAKGGRGKGTSKDYSSEEILFLLSVCKNRVLPISGDDWDVVLSEHSVHYRDKNQTSESIHRKFSSLHPRRNNKIPTGDPNMPREVKIAAKHIRYKIIAKADLGDGTEDMNLTNGVLSQMAIKTDSWGAVRTRT